MPFSIIFHGGQCTYPCFSGVLLTCTPYNILSKPLAAFPQYHLPNNHSTDSGESSGMIPVPVTIINPLKEYWPRPGIESATSCPQVLHTTDCAMGIDSQTFRPME